MTDITPQEAVKYVRDTLENAGWNVTSDSTKDLVNLAYIGKIAMVVSFCPSAVAPMQFRWRLELKSEAMEFCIDFGYQLETLVDILVEYAPQTSNETYRAVIAALAKLLPAVYFLENGKILRQLDLVGWE